MDAQKHSSDKNLINSHVKLQSPHTVTHSLCDRSKDVCVCLPKGEKHGKNDKGLRHRIEIPGYLWVPVMTAEC